MEAQNNFRIFTNEIFSRSFKKFIGGKFVDDLTDWMQQAEWSMRVSARDHFKSTSLYDDFMWRLFKEPFTSREYHYFSYEENMAAYHLSKIKNLIANNEFLRDCIDYKPTAEGVIKYSWDGEHFITMEPHGLLSFKRGIHCDGVYVDDPFQDPENKLILTKVYKINNIIKTQILDMPRIFCKIVGTAQTNDDFFFDKEMQKKFAFLIQSAEVDPLNKIALWPEHMDWEELKEREAIRGKKIYAQEYKVSPVYAENSFFTEQEINKVVNLELLNLPISAIIEDREKFDTFAGWDLGKKRHPAHFTVFQVRTKDGRKKAIQIHQVFFDGWDYSGNDDSSFNPDKPTQLGYITQAIKNFRIDKIYADNTRGELTTLEEKKELPSQIELINFTSKLKFSISTEFEKGVNQEYIELQPDPRMIRQLMVVTNDLQAVETPEGHGDSFWSIALCFLGIRTAIANLASFMPTEDEERENESDVYQKSF
jgi:hypothetical protein